MKRIIIVTVTFLLIGSIGLLAQDKYAQLKEKLTALAGSEIPQLNERVNISVTNVSIQEFLRGVANSSGLNINVDPLLKIDVINNFTDVKVIDILLFLSKQYNLDVTVIGNIININQAKVEQVVQAPPAPKVSVNYKYESGLLSIQSDNEDLSIVAKEIVDKTGKNIVPAAGLDKLKVTGYIQNMPFENALDKFAFANNLKIRKTDDQAYLVEKNEVSQTASGSTSQAKGNLQKTEDEGSSKIKIKRTVGDSLAITASGAPIADIIKEAAAVLKTDIFFTSAIQGESSFTLANISFPSLLKYLFRNTNFTFQVIDGVYIFSDIKGKEMKEFKVIQLQNRTIDKILDFIPADLKADVDLKEFPELNSIVVGGLPERIKSLELFLRSLDKVVPVILIEIMIVENKKGHDVSTGIKAGLGDKPATTKGDLFPEVNMSLGSQSINNLINSFNGFGTMKIGNVTPNFYLNLKALEANNIVEIRSTPKLSTLNGHEATLTIGNTKYYREQQSNIYGSLTSQTSTIENFKSNDANLTITIKPIVAGNDQITMDIVVNQEDFTDQIKEFAPFNKVKREFKSMIRIKNQEMILLGGLEEKKDQNNGSGVPGLARIPVIKWFFSSKTDSKAVSKLNIFIKPTIID